MAVRQSARRAISCRRWLDALARSLVKLRSDADPESVHQLRVAIARLRVWVDLSGLRVLDDNLRWLRSQAAAARDLDVSLALEPPAAVAQWLHAELVARRRALRAALDASRTAGLVEALSLLPPASPELAAERVARLARAALRRGDEARARPADVAALHRLRRAVRRLRFGLEWQGQRARPLVELQTVLGELGDRAIALRALQHIPHGTVGARSYRIRLERELSRYGRRALALWQKTRTSVEGLAR
jgi:CHAD domain-containing protein